MYSIGDIRRGRLAGNAIFLRRGTEKILAELDQVLYENEIVCTIPDEYKMTKNLDILKQPIFKYKLGNGIDKWSNLPYQENTIPAVIVCVKVGSKRGYIGNDKVREQKREELQKQLNGPYLNW